MRSQRRYIIASIIGLVVLVVLTGIILNSPPSASDLWPVLPFWAIITFSLTFAIPVDQGLVSLLLMTGAAAYLVMGADLAGLTTFLSALTHGWIRYRWAKELGEPRPARGWRLIGITLMNAAMLTAGLLAGSMAHQALGGTIPLEGRAVSELIPLLGLGLTYTVVNYAFAAIYIAMRGRKALVAYLHDLPRALFYEASPLVFAPLTALIYTRIGAPQFVLFSTFLIVATLIARGLARTSLRLERRVQELNSLQAVGQALSVSLHVESVVSAIYKQVSKLMPANHFYVALYDAELDEVSFPLAIDDGERIQWVSRRAGNGLTEYVMRTQAPLLLRENVEAQLDDLGIESIGRSAVCWLGVPMLAGEDVLGLISVQSHENAGVYDTSHQEVLVTIAAQAAVAIQNARLYARTDEALAQRVQELNSILRTTQEGLLLMSPEWQVLAVNRALANFLNVTQLELRQTSLNAPRADGASFALMLDYPPEELRADCEALRQGDAAQKQSVITFSASSRHVERTLAPVRDPAGAVAGWLLVLRDITEEIELARLREDMTSMLVHDLRSPLTVVMGSLALMERAIAKDDIENLRQLQDMAHNNSQRILGMVNQLLDISKLESGQFPLDRQTLDVRPLLNKVQEQFAPLAAESNIQLSISVADNLPMAKLDQQIIGRVLNNLVDNALKFTPDSGRVEIWARPDPEIEPVSVMMGVSDTGPGIPAGALSRLFEKFQQVDDTQGRRTGTGLGLPFCKLAVEAHGGCIWVETTVGEGATFVIAFDACPGDSV